MNFNLLSKGFVAAGFKCTIFIDFIFASSEIVPSNFIAVPPAENTVVDSVGEVKIIFGGWTSNTLKYLTTESVLP